MYEFSIHPNINPNVALDFDISTLDLEDLSELPTDWLEQLAAFEQNDAAHFLQDLKKQVGKKSTYTHKTELVNALQIIYYRLTSKLDAQIGLVNQDEINATVIKLKEGVVNCTPGFHDRVNAIVNGYHHPKTFKQLLTKIRETLVQRTAAQLTNEVHTSNHIFLVASTIGLSVPVPFEQDVYHGVISDEKIIRALQNTFNIYFTPLNLPFLIKDALESVFTYFAYHGPMDEDSDGYTVGVYQEIQKYIQNIFQNLFSRELPDLNIVFKFSKKNSALIAINWHYLCHVIFETLLSPHHQEKIIQGIDSILEFPVTNLTDRAMLSTLLNDPAQLWGGESELLQEINSSTLEELAEISESFPAYSQCLKHFIIKERKVSDTQVDILLKQLINKMLVKITEIEFQQLMYLLDIVSTKKYHEIITNLINEKFSKYDLTFLYLICAYGRVEQQDALLTYLFTNFGIEVIKQMLLQKGRTRSNILVFAALNRPKAFFKLLGFITLHWDKLSQECIGLVLFPESRNINILRVFTEHQPKIFSKFLDFIILHWDKLSQECIRLMLLQSNDGKNILMFAVSNRPKVFFRLLDFITLHWNELGVECVQQMLLQKDRDGWNTLILAARYHPKAFFRLLDFITLHWNELGVECVQQMLLQKIVNGCNALMIAATAQPEVFFRLLGFITLYWDQLGVICIQQMLLQERGNGYLNTLFFGSNTLVITAQHQPESFSKLLDFIALRWNDLGSSCVEKILSGLSRFDSTGTNEKLWRTTSIRKYIINFISEISVYQNARVVIFTSVNYLKKYTSEKIQNTYKIALLDGLLYYKDNKLIAKHAIEALVTLGQNKFCDEFLEMIDWNFARQPKACLSLLRWAADDKSFLGCCFTNYNYDSVWRIFNSPGTTSSQDKIYLALKKYEQQNFQAQRKNVITRETHQPS